VSTRERRPKPEVATQSGHSDGQNCPPVKAVLVSHCGTKTKAASKPLTGAAASTNTATDDFPELPAFLRRVK
jgi:hypothetical protein